MKHRSELGIALGSGALERSCEADDYARRLRADRCAQNLERVADAIDPARVNDRRIGRKPVLRTGSAHDPQDCRCRPLKHTWAPAALACACRTS